MPEALHLADLGIFPHILFAAFKSMRDGIFFWLENGEERWGLTMELLSSRLRGDLYVPHDVPHEVSVLTNV